MVFCLLAAHFSLNRFCTLAGTAPAPHYTHTHYVCDKFARDLWPPPPSTCHHSSSRIYLVASGGLCGRRRRCWSGFSIVFSSSSSHRNAFGVNTRRGPPSWVRAPYSQFIAPRASRSNLRTLMRPPTHTLTHEPQCIRESVVCGGAPSAARTQMQARAARHTLHLKPD